MSESAARQKKSWIDSGSGSLARTRIEAIMRNRRVAGLNPAKKVTLAMAALGVPIIIGIGALSAPAFQAPDTPDWQTKAGGSMAFDVASVKMNTEKPPGPLSVP